MPYSASELSPHNAIHIFHIFPHLDILAPRLASVVKVAAETVGVTAGEGDGILHAEVSNRLGEIMKRLLVEAAYRHDFTVQLAQRITQRLVFRFVLNHFSLIYKRILPEEVAILIRGFLEQRRTLRNTKLNLPVQNGTETLLRDPARQQLAILYCLELLQGHHQPYLRDLLLDRHLLSAHRRRYQ